jgi:hypothetical protein
MPPSCLGQEGQALVRLYQRAAFCVKQESGFVFPAFFLTNDTGAGQTIMTSLHLEGVDGNESSLQAA